MFVVVRLERLDLKLLASLQGVSACQLFNNPRVLRKTRSNGRKAHVKKNRRRKKKMLISKRGKKL
jgi:hypothetical protein